MRNAQNFLSDDNSAIIVAIEFLSCKPQDLTNEEFAELPLEEVKRMLEPEDLAEKFLNQLNEDPLTATRPLLPHSFNPTVAGFAVAEGNFVALRLLLETARGSMGERQFREMAFDLFLQSESREIDVAMFDYLLKQAGPNNLDELFSANSDESNTAFLCRILCNPNADIRIVQRVIEAAKSLDVNGHSGTTPLCEAVISNNLSGVRMLLDAGAKINAKDSFGFAAIHYAIIKENKEALKILESRGARSSTTKDVPVRLCWAMLSFGVGFDLFSIHKPNMPAGNLDPRIIRSNFLRVEEGDILVLRDGENIEQKYPIFKSIMSIMSKRFAIDLNDKISGSLSEKMLRLDLAELPNETKVKVASLVVEGMITKASKYPEEYLLKHIKTRAEELGIDDKIVVKMNELSFDGCPSMEGFKFSLRAVSTKEMNEFLLRQCLAPESKISGGVALAGSSRSGDNNNQAGPSGR